MNSGIKSSQRPAEHQTHDFAGVLVAECGADYVGGAVPRVRRSRFATLPCTLARAMLFYLD